jgi:site-specific recombinase XerD
MGKGRKERITPLPKIVVTVIKAWLSEGGPTPAAPLFPTRGGTPHDQSCPRTATRQTRGHRSRGLARKRISPHVLRHSAAMRLLNAGVDTTVIALWLGHENVATTQIYVHADLAVKERTRADSPAAHRTRTIPAHRLPDRHPRWAATMPTPPSRFPYTASTSRVSRHDGGVHIRHLMRRFA